MSTTASNLKDSQIETLRREAREHGDDAQDVICTIALEGALGGAAGFEERFGGGGLRLSSRDMDRVVSMTQDSARTECARVIAAAEAEAYQTMTHSERRTWIRDAKPGDYFARYADVPEDVPADGSRCGYGDDVLDDVARQLRLRDLRLVADDVGLVVVDDSDR